MHCSRCNTDAPHYTGRNICKKCHNATRTKSAKYIAKKKKKTGFAKLSSTTQKLIIGMFEEESSFADVSRATDIPSSTLRRWKKTNQLSSESDSES
jgi:hypothetical protein